MQTNACLQYKLLMSPHTDIYQILKKKTVFLHPHSSLLRSSLLWGLPMFLHKTEKHIRTYKINDKIELNYCVK